VLREFSPERVAMAPSFRRGGQTETVDTEEHSRSEEERESSVDSAVGPSDSAANREETPPHGGNQAESERPKPKASVAGSEDGVQGPGEVSSSSKKATDKELEAQATPDARVVFVLALEIARLREAGFIKLPYITREEIMDKGKSDSFARLIAVGQTLWLVVQMIVRSSRSLEVSQLEVGTAAFVSCAIIIYALNWQKPKGVGMPWALWSFAGRMPRDISRTIGSYKPRNRWLILESFNRPSQARGSSVPNHHRYDSDEIFNNSSINAEAIGIILSSLVFGSIHFAGLKSTFPTRVEMICWCVASAVSTGIILIVIATAGTVMLLEALADIHRRLSKSFKLSMDFDHVFPRSLLFLIVPLYVLARLYLIVELFRCLFFLSPSAFVGTWVSSIPHVS